MPFGIPSLLNSASNAYNTVSLISSDAAILFGNSTPAWGIYLAGSTTPAITADSFNAFGIGKEFNICNYPLEQGSFSDYNKVTLPYTANVRLVISSSLADRSDFLNTLDLISSSTDLYDVATPEKTYLNANINKYDYMRTVTNGAAMIIVDIKLLEIRTTATTAYNNSNAVGSIVPQFSSINCFSPSDMNSISIGQLSLGLPPISSIQQSILSSVGLP